MEEYINEIRIYTDNTENFDFIGDICIDSNSYCEGIIHDKNNNEYFIFGTFEKFNCLELYLVVDNKIHQYIGKMTYLQYDGIYSIIQNDITTPINKFSIKVKSLNVDPRDYYLDNPNTIFKQTLKVFKNKWLTENNNKYIYEQYYENNKRKHHS